MGRLRIPKNAGKFRVIATATGCAVANNKTGGNKIVVPCKSMEEASELCKRLNEKNRPSEIWL